MSAADVDLFMDQDLLEGFGVIERRVDKNIVGERAGRAVAAGLYDAESAVPDHGPRIGLVTEYGDLQQEIGAEEDDAEEVAVK